MWEKFTNGFSERGEFITRDHSPNA